MEEFWEMFSEFEPSRMMIGRVRNDIRYDISALENCSLAILSDR